MPESTSTLAQRGSTEAEAAAPGVLPDVLKLHLSPRAVEFLFALGHDTGESIDEVIRKALGLYRLAVDAWNEGKAVGSVPDPGALDTEFVRS